MLTLQLACMYAENISLNRVYDIRLIEKTRKYVRGNKLCAKQLQNKTADVLFPMKLYCYPIRTPNKPEQTFMMNMTRSYQFVFCTYRMSAPPWIRSLLLASMSPVRLKHRYGCMSSHCADAISLSLSYEEDRDEE